VFEGGSAFLEYSFILKKHDRCTLVSTILSKRDFGQMMMLMSIIRGGVVFIRKEMLFWLKT
jgi:hypothetical protein